MSHPSQSLIDRIPDPIEASLKLGECVAKSGMFGCQNIGQGVVIAFHCLQSGMPLLDFQAMYHLIDGKPSKKPEAMLAAFVGEGGKFEWMADGESGTATIRLGDCPPFSYSIEEAKQAGLVKPKGGWEKNPKAMLRARCVSGAMRMYAPHLVVGVYTPEELEDMRDDDGTTTAVPGEVDLSQSTERPKKPRKKQSDETPTASQPTNDGQPSETAVPVTNPPETPRLPPQADTAAAVPTAAPTAPAGNVTTPEQLETIAGLKQQLNVTPEAWATVLEKLGCPVDPADGKRKIKLATRDQAEHLTTWLRTQVAKAASAQVVKTAEAWVDQGMPINQVAAT